MTHLEQLGRDGVDYHDAQCRLRRHRIAPWWKTRLTAIVLTVGIAVFILASMFLIIAGPTLAENIAARMQLGPAFKWTWWVLQWPVVFALVATAIGLVYYFAPDVEQDWVWITPGSILATLLWLLCRSG